jgi:hypothetical protein
MEQTSSTAYPNVLVVDYVKNARVASAPQILMKAESYLSLGYQKLLTFERPGGGFGWYCDADPPQVWLTAFALQAFADMARVYPIDPAVLDRTRQWLLAKRAADETWSKFGDTHGREIERVGDPKLVLTSYVVWSLLESGTKPAELKESIAYVRAHALDADNAYVLALIANALAAGDARDAVLLKVLRKLERKKKDKPEWKACYFPSEGQSLCYARGESLAVETTALTVLAMLKTGGFAVPAQQGLTYIGKVRNSSGTWDSTQATVLALKALTAGAGNVGRLGTARFALQVNDKAAARGEVTEQNADVFQFLDLTEHLRPGRNEVRLEATGDTAMTYQVVGRHFEPWKPEDQKQPILAVAVDYDRTKLSTADLLKAKATLKYHGDVPTYMVIVDLGIPPGFTVDAGDFAEMVAKKQVQKFTVTSRQVTLYVGEVKKGDVLTFEYALKPKFPIKAKTTPTLAYEYYTPANRATAKPVELTVEEPK